MLKPTIVLTSAVAWHGVTARPQHFARSLALRGWDVLFVDGPITLLSPLKNPELSTRVVPYPPIETIPLPEGSGSLRVLSPVAQLPFGNMYRWINKPNQWLLSRIIRFFVPGPTILLSMLPGSVDLVEYLRPLAVLYDCVDFHAEFPGLVRRDTVNAMEEELVRMSRAVFTTADALYERVAPLHGNVQLVPNAAETAHFARAHDVSEHPLLASIVGPRVGFIGGIGSWIDLEFIRTTADACQDVQFVMIGPVESDISEIKNVSNIHILGRQPYAELPQFLAGFTATLVSFKLSELAQSVNPVKVYEYISAGQEVIATPIRELLKLQDVVWIAKDGHEGAHALRAILGGARKVTQNVSEAFRKENSWDARVDVVERELIKVLPDAYRSTAGIRPAFQS